MWDLRLWASQLSSYNCKRQTVTSANAALWEVPQGGIYAVGRFSVEVFYTMGHVRNMYPSSRMLGC